MKTLHIVSFEVPYPPNYGGVVDIFYKIKALHDLGVQIYLHAFESRNSKNQDIEAYCKKVFYYERQNTALKTLTLTPFIVSSRSNKKLIENLEAINAPILFEGLHTTYPLVKNSFKNRIILIRTHNIEHHYYQGLVKNETNAFTRAFFYIESLKLQYFERILKKANYILTISKADEKYFHQKFGDSVRFLPPFHPNKGVSHPSKKGYFALFHGDFRIAENQRSISYLYEVFSKVDYPLVIAGDLDYSPIDIKTSTNKKISFIQLENEDQLKELLKRAHVNVFPAFQKSGIKLKLINALFLSRFALCHPNIVEGTGLEGLCEIAHNKSEFIKQMYRLIDEEYSEEEILKREEILNEYSCLENAQSIINLIS
ncbi:MAG: hypothetical protein WBN16_06695 [Lutimonas sp.]